MRKLIPLALALTCFSGAASAATPLAAVVALKDFNAIIYGNSTFQSDIEGAAVFGGNVSGATVYNNPKGDTLPAGFAALTVFGNKTGNPINIDNGGSAYVAGSHTTINFNGGGKLLTAAPSVTMASLETTFDTFSTSLSKLAATSTLPTRDNNEVIKADPNAKGVAIFDISASNLDMIPSYKIDLNGATTVVFNVSGSSVNFNANDESGVTGADNIIWNFYQATSVNLGTQIAGSVIAPLAHVTNNNQIDGTLVAASWTGSGELHNYAFDGASPLGVPEPATWALMIVGLTGVGAALRRHRSKGAAAFA